jgi:preprotein translocase subunit SecD
MSAARRVGWRAWAFSFALLLASAGGALAEPLTLAVARATPGLHHATRQPIVIIQVAESSRIALTQLTTNNIGKPVEIRVDGNVLMRPVIREPIFGGTLQVSGNMTIQDVADIVQRLQSGAGKLEIEVVEDE